jgi:hypothetical protein
VLPILVFIENVRGLLKGLYKRDMVCQSLIRDEFSNFHTLVCRLVELGYVTPFTLLDPSTRTPSMRVRAWLPCSLKPPGCTDDDANGLVTLAQEIMNHLQLSTAATIELPRMLIDDSILGKQLWLDRANAESSYQFKGAADDPSWQTKHAKWFKQEGLQYPVVYPEDWIEFQRRVGMTDRELDILFFYNLVKPIGMHTTDETFLNMQASLKRAYYASSGKVPCVLPKARFWKRSAGEWMIAPEYILAQGFDPEMVGPALTEFSHRQVDWFARQGKR